MRRTLVYCVLLAVVFTACTTVRYVPVRETEYVTVRDSVYFRDTLVRIELEKARVSDFVDVGDTLYMRTDLAASTAFLDTLDGKLKGTLRNIMPYVEKPVQIREKIVYRDSVRSVEVPVPVEVEKRVRYVPWYTKAFAFIGILSLVAAALWVVKKVYLK